MAEDNTPRYTTRRLHQEVEAARVRDRADILDLQRKVTELSAALAPFAHEYELAVTDGFQDFLARGDIAETFTARRFRLHDVKRAHDTLNEVRSTVDGLRLPVGAPVVKVSGYGFPGTIVATFHTLAGQERFVVEATGDANGHYAGMLHIFNGDQLDTVENRKRKAGA